ncbi:MAG: hypothetical protein L7W40_13830 [Akkermansiaceae bacterium]|nr:hypothetical protein [Akkermansiaceae bacterium]
MPFPKCLVSFAFVVCQMAPADELSETLNTLTANHPKLEGYQATYELSSNTGQTGTIEIGVDFKSGWSYLISEFKNEKGKLTQQGQQWTTTGGIYFLQSADQKIAFEGLGKLAKRCRKLVEIINPDRDLGIPLRIKPYLYLDEADVRLGIGYSTHENELLSKTEKLISKTDDEIVADLGKLGRVTFETKTGIITSQVITSAEKTRSLKRTTWVNNPGKKAISSRFNIDLKKLQPQDLRGSGMSQDFTRRAFQQLIENASRDQKVANSMRTRLLSIANQFVDFLDQEPLNKAGFINNDFFFKFLDQAMAKTAERLEQDGKKIGVTDILTTPESRNAFIANLVKSFRQQAPPNKKQEYLAEVLNGKLEGSEGPALVARILIEDFVESAYYRVRIGRAIDAYVQKLKGK